MHRKGNNTILWSIPNQPYMRLLKNDKPQSERCSDLLLAVFGFDFISFSYDFCIFRFSALTSSSVRPVSSAISLISRPFANILDII